MAFDDELRRRRRLGELGLLPGSQETLDDYVCQTWAQTHAVTLSPKTAKDYAGLYDVHIAPYLGGHKLGELSAEMISRWQADRIAAGAGRVAVLHALALLGSILQRAVESERIARNPARLVRKIKRSPRQEVRPLAPVTVERLRAASQERDAVLISVLAYAGLRPQEALALCWGHVRERTILVERAVSLGEVKDTKTRAHRTVRLLAPLQDDLRGWRRSQGPLVDSALLFPSSQGRLWTKTDWDNWRRRAFDRACMAITLYDARPYDLRHSFASLLLHEGRSVMYVARQLGHDARLTLSTYGHVIDELDDSPQIPAEDAIRAARSGSCVTGVSQEATNA
ncbi:MAG TPA: tyrosine-type recombinase/integrase [Solirubrobacteraceae bacterium]|nr:tyrosine-type recombinase/integrase [Solirubrobacteraceae bacterium]